MGDEVFPMLVNVNDTMDLALPFESKENADSAAYNLNEALDTLDRVNASDRLWSNATAAPTNVTDPMEGMYNFYETENMTVLAILFVVIVLGNSAVLAALMLSKTRKKRMNFFIMQLAIADLLVGLISVTTDVAWKISVSWNAGLIACKFIRYFQGVVTYSSNYVLVALSIDRYDAIAHPMKFHAGSWVKARCLVFFAWLTSFVAASPLLFLNELSVQQGRVQCWIHLEPEHWQIYITLVFIALFFLPAFIIAACYIVIVKTIWSKSKSVVTCKRRWIGKDAEQNRSLSSFAEDTDVRRASSRGIIPQAKIKTIKMTLIIVCVFISCWSPYVVFDLLQVYGFLPHTQTTIAVATFIQSLAPLNSAANPIIYCLCTTHICSNLRKIKFIDWLARKFCCCCPSNGIGDEHSFQRTTTQHTTTTDAMRGRSGMSQSAIPLHVRRSVEAQSRATNGALQSTKKHAVFVHDVLYKSKSALQSPTDNEASSPAKRALLATRSQPVEKESEIICEAVLL